MTAVLVVAAQRASAAVLYLEHETIGHAPRYGTERIRVLEWVSRSRATAAEGAALP